MIPACVDEDTGYRYYSYDQFIWIEIIKFAKQLRYSLADIKQMIEHIDRNETLEILKKQRKNAIIEKEKINDTIKEIDNIIFDIDYSIETESKIDLYTSKKEKTYVLAAEVNKDDTIQDYDLKLKNVLNMPIFAGIKLKRKYGFILDYQALMDERVVITHVYIKLRNPPEIKNQHIIAIPGGKYMCVQAKVLTNKPKVKKLSKYIGKSNATDGLVTADEMFKSLIDWEDSNFEVKIKKF